MLAADDVTTAMEQGTQVTRVNPIDLCSMRAPCPASTSVDLDGDAYLRRMPADAGQLRRARSCAWRDAGRSRLPPGALIQYFGPPRTYPTVVLLPGPRSGAVPAPGRLQGPDRLRGPEPEGRADGPTATRPTRS